MTAADLLRTTGFGVHYDAAREWWWIDMGIGGALLTSEALDGFDEEKFSTWLRWLCFPHRRPETLRERPEPLPGTDGWAKVRGAIEREAPPEVRRAVEDADDRLRYREALAAARRLQDGTRHRAQHGARGEGGRMRNTLQATTAERAGMLPASWTWRGPSDNRGRFLALVDDDGRASVCRALAISLGHANQDGESLAEAYALVWQSMGCWRVEYVGVERSGRNWSWLFCADDVGEDRETVVPSILGARTSAEALVCIADYRSKEAG